MQPYFLPYIGYFQLIKAVDKYIIYDDVQFIKGGWINRNRILLNGADFLFNLILLGASSNKLINEIWVAENQIKLLKTLELAYKKAPFFADIFPIIDSIINYENKNLAKFIGNSLIQIAEYLNFDTQFIYSSDIKEKNCLLKAQEKVINICYVLNASEYINAIGGMDLYDKRNFERNNIKLSFLKSSPIEYEQFENQFIPNLSILDTLMFNSVDEIHAMLNNYELI
ncbi:MAG: WbqC family protein [Fusobacteriaceae bacterium]|nr:WbqC family protein [Fusobacteriaceae bacterium]